MKIESKWKIEIMEIESIRFQSVLDARQSFYERIQKKNEKFQEFYADLKHLVKFCNFKELAESMVRDRLIFGLSDVKLKKEIIESGGDPKLVHIVAICEMFEQKRRDDQESVADDVDLTDDKGLCNLFIFSADLKDFYRW